MKLNWENRIILVLILILLFIGLTACQTKKPVSSENKDHYGNLGRALACAVAPNSCEKK